MQYFPLSLHNEIKIEPTICYALSKLYMLFEVHTAATMNVVFL
jgi:hypothetical protein